MWWTDPLWLLGLLLLYPLIVSGAAPGPPTRRGRGEAGRGTRLNKLHVLTILRVSGVAAAIMALAGATMLAPSSRRQVVMLIDVSGSIGRLESEAERRSVLEAVRGLDPDDRVAAVAFAGRPSLIMPMTRAGEAAAFLETAELTVPDPGRTDLVAAVRAGRALLDRGHKGNGSIVLFSDGRPTAGGGLEELLARGDIPPVYAVPFGRPGGGLITTDLRVPEAASQGEAVPLLWQVQSRDGAEAIVTLRVDGTPAWTRRMNIPAGASSWRLSLDPLTAGYHRLDLEARRADGGEEPRAAFAALLRVDGPPAILVIREGRDSPVAEALRIQGFVARQGRPETLPETVAGLAANAAIILDNVPAPRLTGPQQTALADYVAGGGGLLVIGGDSSLGRGEYYASGLEDLLPVQTDTRRRLYFTRAAILFIVDHSGSMAEEVGRTSKLRAALDGVASAAAELSPQDEVGIITFDTEAAWILPFTPAGQRRKILDSLREIPQGGGTDLSVALAEAAKGFSGHGPVRRHVVILTDGLTEGKNFDKLAGRLRNMDATITTIAVGNEVNERLLRRIAELGQGRYYRAEQAQIPQVILSETVKISRDLIQEGSFIPAVAERSEILHGLDRGLPALRGYMITKAKNLATVYLSVGKDDPLLAAWRYGNGRVAVFTSDSGRRWLAPWSGRPAYNLLWSQVTRFIARGPQDRGMRLRALVQGGTARIAAEAVDRDGRLRSGLRLLGRYAGRAFTLSETAPGRYEAVLTLEGEGLQEFQVQEQRTGGWVMGGVWNPPGSESSLQGPDHAALGRLSAGTNGSLLQPERPALPKAGWAWTPVSLREPLALLALILMLIEITMRSLSLGQMAMARAAYSIWRQAQERLVEMASSVTGTGNRGRQGRRTFEAHRYLAEKMRENRGERRDEENRVGDRG